MDALLEQGARKLVRKYFEESYCQWTKYEEELEVKKILNKINMLEDKENFEKR